MADPEALDQQPTPVPQPSVNAEDAAPHRREAEEKSANEGPSRGGTFVQTPKNSRYSLRSRNVDETTHLRREKQKRRREEQKRIRAEHIQEELLSKQRRKAKAQEGLERILNIRAMLNEKANAYKEEQRKQRLSRQKDGYYSTDEEEVKKNYREEIINEPPEGSGDWLPYKSDNEFGTQTELKRTSWIVENLTLDLAQCVVGLASLTAGDKQLFTCSGTIVEFSDGNGYVVTSASLVRCSDKDELADELKINIYLSDGEILEGYVSDVDFYYNICVIKVPSPHLLSKSFSPNTEFFNFYGHHSKDIVSLGRSCKPWSLMVALGKLIPRRSKFVCEELFVSSCKVGKIGIGGPVMDFEGNVIGMNFYDKKGTPFLPSFIVLKCLQHFKDFRKVIRPLHGLQVRNLYDAELTSLEQKIQCGLPEVYGVVVEKVEDSSVEHSEIKVGDVITHVNGVPFSNAAELGGILLDKCHKHMLDRQKSSLSDDCNQMATMMSLKLRARIFKGHKSEVTTQTIDVDKFTPSSSGLNRWPLPSPIFIRRYAHGELILVERYMTDD